MSRSPRSCSERQAEDACRLEPAMPADPSSGKAGDVLVELELSGLGCPTCATRVRNALVGVQGVLDADVRVRPQHASVIYDSSRTYPERLMAAVIEAGSRSGHRYLARVIRVRLLGPWGRFAGEGARP
ncbi:MAG TPA: heavy-metal-associated domain-containing protein [Trueperaceae bacterium]|jgi:copper chaperone CopZ